MKISEELLPESVDTYVPLNTPASGFSSEKNALRTPLLCAFLVLLFIVFLWLLPLDRVISTRVYRTLSLSKPRSTQNLDFTEEMKNDPGFGTALPTEGAGKVLRSDTPPSLVGYLVVPVGDCASCIKADLREWERNSKELGISMVLISSADPEKIKAFSTHAHITVPVIIDQKHKLAESLNVLWLSRPYFYTPDWKLAWVSKNMETNPFLDKRFKSLVKGAKP